MYATRDLLAPSKTIVLASNLVDSLTGKISGKGYKVNLHSLPDYTFNVEAETGDQAIARAVALCRSHGKKVTDAATFQALWLSSSASVVGAMGR